jgi:hypothetical protein
MAQVNPTRGAQYALTAIYDLAVGDTVTATDGSTATIGAAGSVVFDAIRLPAGATITSGKLIVSAAFNDGTAATLDIGDRGDDDRYSATQVNVASAAISSLDFTGYSNPSGYDLQLTMACTDGDATTGALRLIVEYVVDSRINEAQTH